MHRGGYSTTGRGYSTTGYDTIANDSCIVSSVPTNEPLGLKMNELFSESIFAIKVTVTLQHAAPIQRGVEFISAA